MKISFKIYSFKITATTVKGQLVKQEGKICWEPGKQFLQISTKGPAHTSHLLATPWKLVLDKDFFQGSY